MRSFEERSELDGRTYTVQYFERAVFELHRELPTTSNVLLSQLGTFRLGEKYGNCVPQPGPPAPGSAPQPTAPANPGPVGALPNNFPGTGDFTSNAFNLKAGPLKVLIVYGAPYPTKGSLQADLIDGSGRSVLNFGSIGNEGAIDKTVTVPAGTYRLQIKALPGNWVVNLSQPGSLNNLQTAPLPLSSSKSVNSFADCPPVPVPPAPAPPAPGSAPQPTAPANPGPVGALPNNFPGTGDFTSNAFNLKAGPLKVLIVYGAPYPAKGSLQADLIDGSGRSVLNLGSIGNEGAIDRTVTVPAGTYRLQIKALPGNWVVNLSQ